MHTKMHTLNQMFSNHAASGVFLAGFKSLLLRHSRNRYGYGIFLYSRRFEPCLSFIALCRGCVRFITLFTAKCTREFTRAKPAYTGDHTNKKRAPWQVFLGLSGGALSLFAFTPL